MRCRACSVVVVILLLISSFPFLFISSPANAEVFGENIQVDNDWETSGSQVSPRIAVDANLSISVVWAEESGPDFDIWYARSEDNGSSFLDKVRVDDTGTGFSNQSSPSIAVNATGSIFIVWSDDRSGEILRIYISRSDDNGSTFSSNVQVPPSGTNAQYTPDIAIANDTIFVVWAEAVNTVSGFAPKIFVSRSFDWGVSFEAPLRIDSTGTAFSLLQSPRISARNESVLVVWQDTRADENYYDIFAALSTDSGVTYGIDEKISDGPSLTRQTSPDLCFLPDGSAVVVWEDQRSGAFEIRAAVSENGGESFNYSVAVSDGESCTAPAIASDAGGNISVVYREHTADSDQIRYAISRTGGATFSSSIRVDDVPLDVNKRENPDVGIGYNETALVVFQDRRTGDEVIWFSRMVNRPPVCSITTPTAGATVEGVVSVMGNASDPDGNGTLVSVEVRIVRVGGTYDSGWNTAIGIAPWDYLFDTSAVLNGQYQIQARSSDGESFSETASLLVTVDNPVQLWPDLYIASGNITLSPTHIEAGDVVTITADVRNIGNVNATNVEVKFLRGTSQIGGIETIGLVAPGESRSTEVQWQALEGDHTISVEIDPANTIDELNEENNDASIQLTVHPSTFYRPDMEVSAGNVTVMPSSIAEGESVTITATVFNLGTEEAYYVTVVFNVDGVQIGPQKIISLIPVNESANASVTWTAIRGSHQISVLVDPANSTYELNEENNNATITVEVSAVGDFPIWIVAIVVVIILVLVGVMIWVMKWRRPKY